MTDTTIRRALITGAARGLGLVATVTVLVLGLLALNWVFEGATFKFVPSDSTDTLTVRSMLTIRTDALTGLQYLETTGGGLAPRMGPDGRQMSTGDENLMVEARDAGAGEAHD